MRGKAKILPVSIAPATVLSQTPWWGELSSAEQVTVEAESVEIAEAFLTLGKSKLAVGEHLARVRDVLEPKGHFEKFLAGFHLSRSTAYRYIRGWETTHKRLPESVVKVAMAKGLNIIGGTEAKPFGIYSRAIKTMPPPKAATARQADKYVTRLEATRKAQNKVTRMPRRGLSGDDLVQQCFDYVAVRYKKLPEDAGVRRAWMRHLVGKLQNIDSLLAESVPSRRGRRKAVAAAA